MYDFKLKNKISIVSSLETCIILEYKRDLIMNLKLGYYESLMLVILLVRGLGTEERAGVVSKTRISRFEASIFISGRGVFLAVPVKHGDFSLLEI